MGNELIWINTYNNQMQDKADNSSPVCDLRYVCGRFINDSEAYLDGQWVDGKLLFFDNKQIRFKLEYHHARIVVCPKLAHITKISWCSNNFFIRRWMNISLTSPEHCKRTPSQCLDSSSRMKLCCWHICDLARASTGMVEESPPLPPQTPPA